MQVFPVVSKVNGRIVTGATTHNNAGQLARALDKLHGAELTEVGEPINVNPAWSKTRDPEQAVLRGFLALALAGADVRAVAA